MSILYGSYNESHYLGLHIAHLVLRLAGWLPDPSKFLSWKAANSFSSFVTWGSMLSFTVATIMSLGLINCFICSGVSPAGLWLIMSAR